MAINRDEDGRFQEMARALAVQERPRKTRIADSIDEGFDSLDMDPYLMRQDDDDDNVDSRAYVMDYGRRDFSRPGPGGFATEQGLSFWLPLNDLGDGQVDIRAAAGWLNGQQGTFTRATAATCRLKNGLLKKVLSGVPRSHYLASGAYGGYLAEGARTNLILRSEEFDNASWVPVASGVVAPNTADTTAPDGTPTADKFTAGAALFGGIIRQAFTFAVSTTYTQSVFVKKGNHRYIGLRISTAVTTDDYNFIDLDTGTINNTVVAGAVLSAEAWADGWYRLSLTFTTPGAAPGNAFDIAIVNSSGAADITPAGTETVYLWGAQLEAAAFASSYIPTTTASATRNADVLTFPFGGNVDATQGTVYAEFIRLMPSAAAPLNVGIGFGTDASGSNWVLWWAGAAPTTIRMGDGSADVQKNGVSDITTGVRKRIAAWGGSTMEVTGDGLAPASASFDGAMASAGIGIGCSTNGTQQICGTVANVHIWQRKLPTADLQARTT